jgi:nitrite reductase/ring-hydroxylating ferredoxin subunit
VERIGSLATLQERKALSVKVKDKLLAVFLVEDRVVATDGKCPHAGGPLFQGDLQGDRLSCPWHGWNYCLTTGACDEDPSITLPFYSVRVEGDDLILDL